MLFLCSAVSLCDFFCTGREKVRPRGGLGLPCPCSAGSWACSWKAEAPEPKCLGLHSCSALSGEWQGSQFICTPAVSHEEQQYLPYRVVVKAKWWYAAPVA